MESVQVEIRGIVPLIMHRYVGEQPSKEKPPRGKKTQAHIEAQHKADWIQSAYWSESQRRFYIPAEMIEAALAESAKAFRFGTTFKKSIAVVDFFIPLRAFKGPDDQEGFQPSGELEDWYKPGFVDIRGVRIGPSKIDRCRPIFHHWGLSFTLRYDDTVTVDQLKAALSEMALGDKRPRYGRASLVSFSSKTRAAA